ncbi:hypothetical protein B0H19DRAFT_434463 [Mycena capillaripes]|nr:hypothetical protein B0H19DRAFT_434463 [Mycena capillaripes]
MPGKKPKKPSKDSTRTDGTGDKEYEESAVQFCSMDQCFNYKDLKSCSRCKSARYCSVECQRNNWKQHKPVCNHNVGQFALADGEEPLLERNLRHWAVRFDATLLSACIRGLNLKFEWERIGQGGLVLFMEPRLHANVGSRWRIQNAGVFENKVILDMLDKVGMAEQYLQHVLPMHNEARERLQKSTSGTADYASVFMIAGNLGPDALDGDHPPTFRFKPMDVFRATVADMPMAQYDGDWLEDLKRQVYEDHPLKYITPTQQ